MKRFFTRRVWTVILIAILAAVILIPMAGFCIYVIIGLIVGFSKKGKFDAKKKK